MQTADCVCCRVVSAFEHMSALNVDDKSMQVARYVCKKKDRYVEVTQVTRGATGCFELSRFVTEQV
jgi:hypothetical protein